MPACVPFSFVRCFHSPPSHRFSRIEDPDETGRMSHDWIFGVRPRNAPCSICGEMECACVPRIPNHRTSRPPRSILRNSMPLPREGNPIVSTEPSRNPGISVISEENYNEQPPSWFRTQVPTLSIANAPTPVFPNTPMSTPAFLYPAPQFPMMVCTPAWRADAVLTPAAVPVTLTPAVSVHTLAGPAPVFGAAVGPTMTWVPHPQPHPTIPASAFWTQNILGGPRQWPSTPLDTPAVLRLTGGWPLPGTAPAGWTPVWPPCTPLPGDRIQVPVRLCPWLAPNPANPQIPHMVWDISQLPSIAKRMTGRHSVVYLTPKFDDDATYPACNTIHIVCDAGNISTFWGPIVVRNDDKIVLWDVLDAIYNYFQTPLTQAEVDTISDLKPGNFESLKDAYYHRCRNAHGLFQYELEQGFKRVDCLGDSKAFWGLWITYNPDSTWQLNLGLVPIKR